jgi:tetratricopeptide (TPR) repeat protein
VPRRSTKTLAASASSPADRLRIALVAEDLARAADAAMELGPAARNRLPESIRPGFDAVCDAFALYESGNDDAAREKLQLVGLSSPLLEWKLLLRGLIAHAVGEDDRALDNWSRLTAGRLPAKLASPIRFSLDQSFRAAQPPGVQAVLQRQGDRLRGALVPKLRALQTLLTRSRLEDAFRHTESLLPELKRELPHAIGRLADCFRAAIVVHGEPADLGYYRRLFGAPADDPNLDRLAALTAEEHRDWRAAHDHWKAFEQTLADNKAWPAADRDRSRALVWCRMGRNADDVERCRRRMQPNAEACYKRAIQLAPDLVEPYEQSFLMLRDRKRVAAALAAGKRLLKQFPEHGPTLEAMAELCYDRGHSAEALDFARRALAVNPLDRHIRGGLAEILRLRARTQAAVNNCDAAENDLAEALLLADGRPDAGLVAQAGVIAFKSGRMDIAEERVRQALAAAPVAAAYSLAAEAARLALPRPLRQRFDTEFATAVATPPTCSAAVALAVAYFEQSHAAAYTGQKGHEKKVQAYVDAALATESAEADLVNLCERLGDLGWRRFLKKAATLGQRRFRQNPFFPFFEATVHLADEKAGGPPVWKVEPLLEKSRRLAAAHPPDESIRRLLRELDELNRRLTVTTPVMELFTQLFDAFDRD